MFDFAKADNGTVIEGFLNDNKEAKILFLLREPHTYKKGEPIKEQQDFWFKRILDDEYDDNCHAYFRNTNNLVYFNTLASIASYILDQPSSTHDDITAIKSCAYMNLFAKSGEGYASKKYSETRDSLYCLLSEETPKETFSTDAAERAARVYGLLRDFIESGTDRIVTVYDIYNMLSKYCRKNTQCGKNSVWLTLRYKNHPERRKMSFNCCNVRLFDHDVTLYNIWHPSYRYYDFALLKNELKEYYIELPERV